MIIAVAWACGVIGCMYCSYFGPHGAYTQARLAPASAEDGRVRIACYNILADK